jgi:hypothetical protein
MKKLINITLESLKHLEEKYHSRLYVCDECEYNKMNICQICYCFVTSKAAIPSAKCPKGKW